MELIQIQLVRDAAQRKRQLIMFFFFALMLKRLGDVLDYLYFILSLRILKKISRPYLSSCIKRILRI